MLTKDQFIEAKKNFCAGLRGIKREGADIEGLINYLEKETDFFQAPATTKYFCAFPGGLMIHSLNTITTLKRLVDSFATTWKTVTQKDKDGKVTGAEIPETKYSLDTLLIVGLLCNLGKVNYYEQYSRNVKINDSWQQIQEYRIKEAGARETFGNQNLNAYMMITKFIPLSKEETNAILNFHCDLGTTNVTKDLHSILARSDLTVLLHCANMIASYTIEKHE